MQLNLRDVSYIIDMYDCIKDIIEYTKSITYYEFEKDKMRRLAVERQLEVIGQAANKVSKETQNILNVIPWAKIIGLRNKLAHEYGDILAKRIWDISTSSVKDLFTIINTIEDVKKYIV